ncbi:MAG: Uma2 family endonuclease [Dehalococcoidia bacterium]|nr:Uma2 family endonuclease [Dehalococcoidia bacterium]
MTTIAIQPQIARRLFTVAEYMAMGEAGILHEDEHVELLGGEIIQMAAIGNRHLFCTDSLTTLLVPALVGHAIVRVQGSIQLDDYGMPEPDIVLLRPRPDYHAETATPEDVLLLIEVADSSLEYDYGPKSEFYAAAGITEMWIANLRTGEVEARTDPVGTEYTAIRTIPTDGSINPQAFPDVTLLLSEFMPPANA